MFTTSPYGYNQYDHCLGLWQPITIEEDGVNITVPQANPVGYSTFVYLITVPQLLDESVHTVTVNCSIPLSDQIELYYYLLVCNPNTAYVNEMATWNQLTPAFVTLVRKNLSGFELFNQSSTYT